MRHSSRFGAMGQGKTYGLASCALMFTGTSCRLPGPRNQITDLRKPMSQTSVCRSLRGPGGSPTGWSGFFNEVPICKR
jgi:hypothetical protein